MSKSPKKPTSKVRKVKNISMGMDVMVSLGPNYSRTTETLHNVTEIHYKYESLIGGRDRVAFESDIHGTGLAYHLDDVKEFEAKVAKKIHESF